MGNCLDIPAPAETRRSDNHDKAHYIRNVRPVPPPAGHVRVVPNDYATYPVYGGPESLLADGSGEVQQYAYPREFLESAYGHGVQIERETHYRRSRVKKEKVSENGEIPDRNANTQIRNANVNSTIITTSTDPRDDIITRGHEIVVTNGIPGKHNGVIATITSGAIRPTTNTGGRPGSVTSSSTDAATTVNQNIVVQSQVTAAPVATRGSTYITYIEDEPPPPPPEPQVETTEVVEEIHVRKTEKQEVIETNQTGGFIEVGVADASAVQFFIDEPVAETTVVRETRSAIVTTEWLKRFGSSYRSSFADCDVALCYDPTDATDASVMWKIKKELESTGFGGAIADIGLMDWSTFSQAVIHAKVMIVLLSPQSIKNKHVQDLVSLAHITETSVYPVVLGPSVSILGAMNVGLKLQLVSYNWTELKEGSLTINITMLVQSVKVDFEVIKSYEIIDEDYGEVSSWAHRRRKIVRQRQVRRLISLGSQTTALKHWDKVYASGVKSVLWERFYRDLRTEYQDLLNSTVPKSCSPYLMENLKREIGVGRDGLVHKAQFVDRSISDNIQSMYEVWKRRLNQINLCMSEEKPQFWRAHYSSKSDHVFEKTKEFCTEFDTDLDVWERIHSIARETQAIRDVFDAGSTVRMVAIENVGKFGSQNVMSALRDLLKDRDSNIRAAAAIVLSQSMLAGDHVTLTALKALLNDREGIVREAGCLALGHLRAREAVDKLMHLRQNDVVIQVRNAAATALREIEGTDADADDNASHISFDD